MGRIGDGNTVNYTETSSEALTMNLHTNQIAERIVRSREYLRRFRVLRGLTAPKIPRACFRYLCSIQPKKVLLEVGLYYTSKPSTFLSKEQLSPALQSFGNMGDYTSKDQCRRQYSRLFLENKKERAFLPIDELWGFQRMEEL